MRRFIGSPRPAHYECAALPTELHQHIKFCKVYDLIRQMSLYNRSETCALRMRFTLAVSEKYFASSNFFDRYAIFIVLYLPQAADAENATD